MFSIIFSASTIPLPHVPPSTPPAWPVSSDSVPLLQSPNSTTNSTSVYIAADHSLQPNDRQSRPCQHLRDRLPLSELPRFLDKTHKLDVPITRYGALAKISWCWRSCTSGDHAYKIDNLHVIDEAHHHYLSPQTAPSPQHDHPCRCS
jgi:hypothetical protein